MRMEEDKKHHTQDLLRLTFDEADDELLLSCSDVCVGFGNCDVT